MSMWEVEYLMEVIVRLIDNNQFSTADKRNLIYNTYAIQNQFDTSYNNPLSI